MIAEKKTTEQVVSSDLFELFELVDRETADGDTVSVKQSIGTYRVADLENQKTHLLAEIAKVDEKLDAISAL